MLFLQLWSHFVMWQSWLLLKKKIGSFGGRKIIISYGKILAAVAVMGAVLYFLWDWLENFAYQDLWTLILLLFLAIVAGAGIYITCTFLFKMEEIKFVAGLFKKFGKNT